MPRQLVRAGYNYFRNNRGRWGRQIAGGLGTMGFGMFKKNIRQSIEGKIRGWRRNRAIAGRANKTAVKAKTGLSTRQSAKKGRFKRKRSKKVKVSSHLRAKVQKVIDSNEDEYAGKFVSYRRPAVLGPRSENTKTVHSYPNYVLSGTVPNTPPVDLTVSGELFSWNIVLDAAAKLYNGKTGNELPDILDPDNFQPRTFQCKVLGGRARYWLKNNSQRTATVTLYKFTSKVTSSGNYFPLYTWQREHAVAAAQNLVTGFTMTNAGPSNSINAQTTQYKNEPDLYDSFNKRWVTEKVKFVLEPGQTSVQDIIHKPQEMKGSEFYFDNVYQDQHKGAVYTAIGVMFDVVSGGDNVGGTGFTPTSANFQIPEYPAAQNQVVDSSFNIGQAGVIVECENIIRMALPEQAGFQQEGTFPPNQWEALDARKQRYYYEEWTNNANTTQRVDEQQPEG
jgi:hypothetical protein